MENKKKITTYLSKSEAKDLDCGKRQLYDPQNLVGTTEKHLFRKENLSACASRAYVKAPCQPIAEVRLFVSELENLNKHTYTVVKSAEPELQKRPSLKALCDNKVKQKPYQPKTDETMDKEISGLSFPPISVLKHFISYKYTSSRSVAAFQTDPVAQHAVWLLTTY